MSNKLYSKFYAHPLFLHLYWNGPELASHANMIMSYLHHTGMALSLLPIPVWSKAGTSHWYVPELAWVIQKQTNLDSAAMFLCRAWLPDLQWNIIITLILGPQCN